MIENIQCAKIDFGTRDDSEDLLNKTGLILNFSAAIKLFPVAQLWPPLFL